MPPFYSYFLDLVPHLLIDFHANFISRARHVKYWGRGGGADYKSTSTSEFWDKHFYGQSINPIAKEYPPNCISKIPKASTQINWKGPLGFLVETQLDMHCIVQEKKSTKSSCVFGKLCSPRALKFESLSF